MTDVIRGFTLTIPPNGSVNNVFFTDCELGDSNVTKILLQFPPGLAALVGVRIEHGGTQAYPLDKGTWFIFDDYTLQVEPTSQGTSGQWHIAGYNTDIYQHSVRAYFFYDYVDMQPSGSNSPSVSL